MKPYSLDLRQKVVQAYKQGNDSYRQLAKRFQVSLSFGQRLLKRAREQGTLLPERLGTPTVGQLQLYREQIVQYLQECNDLTLAQLC
ncbi:transposase, partial [Pleurocapsales cyanobacterium LEGE 06147]|nr:transposase [Pleurocapsales cyanobacterium LEGE 06147]